MQAVAISAEQLGVEELRGRIDIWRQNAPKSRNMPEELWKDACTAAKRLGACRVARALGVKYETLKQRVLADGGAGIGGAATVLPRGTQFIELTGLSGLSHTGADEAVVELAAADGARLTIRLKGAGLDVAALVRAFRGRP